MYCPNCGEQVAEESKYCAKCGASLDGTAAQAQTVVVKQRTSGLAVAALVLGIIGLFFNLLGVLAIIFGGISVSQTGRDPSIGGRGMAIAGLVLGIIDIAIWVIILIFASTFWAFFI